jgi:hypothetical protein
MDRFLMRRSVEEIPQLWKQSHLGFPPHSIHLLPKELNEGVQLVLNPLSRDLARRKAQRSVRTMVHLLLVPPGLLWSRRKPFLELLICCHRPLYVGRCLLGPDLSDRLGSLCGCAYRGILLVRVATTRRWSTAFASVVHGARPWCVAP